MPAVAPLPPRRVLIDEEKAAQPAATTPISSAPQTVEEGDGGVEERATDEVYRLKRRIKRHKTTSVVSNPRLVDYLDVHESLPMGTGLSISVGGRSGGHRWRCSTRQAWPILVAELRT